MLTLIILITVGWIAPAIALSFAAEKAGQDASKVLLAVLLASWFGGILALILLPVSARKKFDASRGNVSNEPLISNSSRTREQIEELYSELVGGKKKPSRH